MNIAGPPVSEQLFFKYLTMEHIDDVAQNKWLTDLHIRAVSEMLKSQQSSIGGLFDPVLQQNMSWDVPEGEFIQILNKDNCHWLTVSNIGCPKNTVAVYDSLLSSKLSQNLLMCIASLMGCIGDDITIQIKNVQRQMDSYSWQLHLQHL